MIDVLNIISDTNIGGAGRVILNYLRYADRDQFCTTAAVPSGSLLVPELQALGVTVYEVSGMADRSYHRDDVKTLRELIRRVNPDIVHTHGALSGRIAARQCGKKVIYTRHSVFPVPARLRYPPGRWVNKLFNEYYADHIIAVNPAAEKNLTDMGISSKKITVVFNGVSPVAPISEEEKKKLRLQFDLPPDAIVFGIFARIEDYKGHLDIIHAAKRLKEHTNSFRILMAGTGSFEAEVKRAMTEFGVSDVVSYLGFQRDVGPLFNILDVQLNASYGTEATSLALLEGMSLGLPSIASDYGGNPWLITNEENGLIFPARDSAALSQCMRRMIEDPELRHEMAQRSKTRFQERFTGEVFARQIEAVYVQTLGRSGSSQKV